MPSPLYVRCQLAYMVNSIIMEEQKVPSGMLFLCVWESMFCFSSVLAWPQINWIRNEWGKISIEMGEWTSLSSVSILLLFIRPSLRFLTDKWIWTDKLPKPLTPLHSKTPESAKLTPLILRDFRLVRNRSLIGLMSWSSWYHSMIGFGKPLIGQFSLTTSSSWATYFSLYPSSTTGGPNGTRRKSLFLCTLGSLVYFLFYYLCCKYFVKVVTIWFPLWCTSSAA